MQTLITLDGVEYKPINALTAAAHDLIFLENRRTPKVVPEGEEYEPTEAEGKIVKRRAATEEEEKTIASGDWVRVNENGDKPGDGNYMKKKSKVRPQLNSSAAATSIAPPADWYQLPGGHTDAYDVVIEDNGRVHGYPAATWDSCHLSFPDECVTPPRSQTDYAYFKVGNVVTADGSRVRTGPLTLKGGHADGNLSASKAMAFYDDTRSAFADVTIGEDEHGIWIAGSTRPDADPTALRAAMASGFSGDWRWIGDGYELIALSAVNTPGFRRRVDLTKQHGMVASMILDMPRDAGDEPVDVEVELSSCSCHTTADNLESTINHIAASIGRTPEQRLDALRKRVHPEPTEVA